MPEATIAPPPAPTTPQAPATTQSPELANSGASEAFSLLDDLSIDDSKPDTTPEAPKEQSKPAEKPRDQGGKFAKLEDKPAEPKPEPKAKVEPAPEVPTEKMAPKQLREAYESLKAKHKALESEHTTLKTKASTPADDPEKKSLAEKLQEREKRLQDLENEIKFTDYSKSEDYKERFEKPFVDAYLSGRAKVAALKTAQRTNDVGEVVQESRQGTPDDFDALMKIADDDAAADWASEKFGNKAAIVLHHRERVQELNSARTKAVEEYRKNGLEREKVRSQEFESAKQAYISSIEQAEKAAIEKYPQWFKPDDTDAKGNEILDRGMHLVKRVLANGAPVKSGEPPMNPQQLAAAVAAVRNKAGAFDRLAYRHKQAQSTIKELQTKLAQYEASAPKAGDAKGSQIQSDADTPESAFDAAFKQK